MIWRSPYADVAVPEVPLSRFVLAPAPARGAKPALIDGRSGCALSYAELAARVERTAAGLARAGFGKGEVLAMISRNVPEYAVAFHAAARLGGTITTVNPLATAAEVQKQLADCGARFAVAEPERSDELAACGIAAFALGTPSWDELAATAALVPEVAIDPRRDVVALPYSSGTTGLPKGVMLTHRNLVANVVQLEAVRDLRQDDVLLAVLPFHHIYGITIFLNVALHVGATLVVLPRFDLDEYLRALARWRVTYAHVVPPIVLALARHPDVGRHDLSSLRRVFSGAAPLSAELTRECGERLRCPVLQGYGMTEASPATHMSPSDPRLIEPGTVGWLLPGTECRIVDPGSGAELGPGQEGELWVRGPQVMKGYLKQPEATARTVDADGWLLTGDIGRGDAKGTFTVVDRVKELIKYKGFQVAPAELEAVLLTHPRVADAAVVGAPDDAAGELPVAYVVARGTVPAGEILDFVAARVAPHKKVRRVEFVAAIPKSPSGKILRRVLAERERGRA